MTRSFKQFLAVAAGIALLATPVGAAHADATIPVTPASAYNPVPPAATAAATNPPISCRVENPVYVGQPELGGRVTVRGGDTAVGVAVCVDPTLSSDYAVTVRLFLEYYDPNRRAWLPVLDGQGRPVATECTAGATRGTAVVVCSLSASYPAKHPAAGRLRRTGSSMTAPYQTEPVYTADPLASALQAAEAAGAGQQGRPD